MKKTMALLYAVNSTVSSWYRSDLQTDWDESSEEDEEKPAHVPVAPPKKKGTLKQKLVEKEAEKARRRAAEEEDDDYDSDEVLDPREKARKDEERQLQGDMNNAADLFGAAALGGMSRAHRRSFLTLNLRDIIIGPWSAHILPTSHQGGLRTVLL